ncbi:MAG: hypothetical protein JNM14_04680 [Ferruginibacter sp.]|nr:hypothetical protein [Ferruginibacter sp.]
MKITDINYRLPEIFAQGFHESFTTSANKPLLITGVDKTTGEQTDCVVKLKAAERMSNEASMRELLACFISMELDLPIVTPAVVEITPQFVETLRGNDSWQPANKSLGYNFGSINITDHKTLIINQPLNNHQLTHAQNTFAFDMFIQNSDRTNNKPNVLTNGNDIIMLDHEIAFGFVFAPFLPSKIWEMQEVGKDWIRNHCLLPLIKGKEYNYDEFSEKLDNLSNAFWDCAKKLIPIEWMTDQFDFIKTKLSEFINEKDKFILELKKIMS